MHSSSCLLTHHCILAYCCNTALSAQQYWLLSSHQQVSQDKIPKTSPRTGTSSLSTISSTCADCVYDMERHHHFMYELCICHWVYTSKSISIVLVLHKNVSSSWVFSLHKCALNDEDSLFPVRPQESFNNPTKWYCKLRSGTSIWKSFDGIEEQVRNLSLFLLNGWLLQTGNGSAYWLQGLVCLLWKAKTNASYQCHCTLML